jgi:hypothetical protein
MVILEKVDAGLNHSERWGVESWQFVVGWVKSAVLVVHQEPVLCCARLGSVTVGELDWIKRVEKGKLREETSTTERSAIWVSLLRTLKNYNSLSTAEMIQFQRLRYIPPLDSTYSLLSVANLVMV